MNANSENQVQDLDSEDAPWIPKTIGEVGPIRERMTKEERAVWVALKMDPDRICQNRHFRRDLLIMMLEEQWMPPWQLITHLHPKHENGGVLRRKQVRLLIKVAKILIRKELRVHEADPEKDERTPYWDPLVEVCRTLGISKSGLSKYSVELTGLTAKQLCDMVRVENVKSTMRSALRAELQTFFGRFTRYKEAMAAKPLSSQWPANPGELDHWEAWHFLKKRRWGPNWAPNARALKFGFSSYTKFYRACVANFRKTPQQLELEVIEELIREYNGESLAADKTPETLEELNAQLKELVPQGHFVEEVARHSPKLE